MYELIAGKDVDDNASSLEKLSAYIACSQDDGCGYVVKEKASGKFIKKRTVDVLNETIYAVIWKKKPSGEYILILLEFYFINAPCRR